VLSWDLIYKMLEYDPAKRIRPAQALEHPFFVALNESIQPPSPAVAATATTGPSSTTTTTTIDPTASILPHHSISLKHARVTTHRHTRAQSTPLPRSTKRSAAESRPDIIIQRTALSERGNRLSRLGTNSADNISNNDEDGDDDTKTKR